MPCTLRRTGCPSTTISTAGVAAVQDLRRVVLYGDRFVLVLGLGHGHVREQAIQGDRARPLRQAVADGSLQLGLLRFRRRETYRGYLEVFQRDHAALFVDIGAGSQGNDAVTGASSFRTGLRLPRRELRDGPSSIDRLEAGRSRSGSRLHPFPGATPGRRPRVSEPSADWQYDGQETKEHQEANWDLSTSRSLGHPEGVFLAYSRSVFDQTLSVTCIFYAPGRRSARTINLFGADPT